MPVSLIPTRRRFLQAAIPAPLLLNTAPGQSEEPLWFALLADTHIDVDPERVARGACMAENLKTVVAEILAEPSVPQFAVINGDCAFSAGLKSEYEVLRPILQPLLDREIPIHLTMGNHDDRGPFFELFPEAVAVSPAEKKHLTVIETPHANWFLLDTLQIVNKVTGELGEAQRTWLAKELKRLADKPALIIGHHYLQEVEENYEGRITGLADTKAFLEILRGHPQVKAYFCGHSHSYGSKEIGEGLRQWTQPPVAYLFDQVKPNGWLRADLTTGDLTLELRALDKMHTQHQERSTIAL